MPNDTQNLKPKSGVYFTGDDVPPALPNVPFQKNDVEPKILVPLKKQKEVLWNKEINRIAGGNGSSLGGPPKPKNSIYPPIQNMQKPPEASLQPTLNPRRVADPKASQPPNQDIHANFPPYLRYLMSPTLKRATGVPAWVWTVKVTTEKNGKATKKFQEFHLIVCYYQFVIGALGGVAVGLETGFFTANRLASPNIPLPQRMETLRTVSNFGIQKSSSLYRLCKRALISGYLFDVLDKNVEEYRQQQDWKNMGIAGGITGLVFGLRGGFRSCIAGALLFAGFGSLAGYQFYTIKEGKRKRKPKE